MNTVLCPGRKINIPLSILVGYEVRNLAIAVSILGSEEIFASKGVTADSLRRGLLGVRNLSGLSGWNRGFGTKLESCDSTP